MRKNFSNLRQATKVLQCAWREKKKSEHNKPLDNDLTFKMEATAPSPDNKLVDHRSEIEKDRAAATLQAATRRMIARKSFETVRKQTLATLVIQKHLTNWWVTAKHTSADDVERQKVDNMDV
jgi:roadblock/LC7 domain-containing protein